MTTETKAIEDMTPEELREALRKARGDTKGPSTPLDKPDIMTSRGEDNDDETDSGLHGRSSDTQPSRPRSESAGVSERSQDESEGQERPRQSESQGSEAVRREPDGERDAGLRSVADGDTVSDSGDRERLAPRDLVLSRDSEIGHNAGAATRFDANLAALRTLKQIEAENRHATPEEQATMARYSGFGDSGMGEAFPRWENDNYRNTPWGKRRAELKELTTDDEFKSIERSRINAFYTTPDVINRMWDGLEKAGVGKLANPRILEPSAGSGRFLGYQPKEMAAKSERVAVELDSLTGRLLRHIYPQAETYVMGFEKAPIPKDSIDVAISNVPFGNVPIFDPDFKKDRKKLTRSVHNYFFAKTLDVLRPGGVLAFVTSHETMDAPTAKPIRQYLADRADLINAVRLPNNAFPDTKVVTDIIYLRKRMPGEKAGDQSWVNTTTQTFKVKSEWGDGYDVKDDVNDYFVKNPEKVLGTPTVGRNMGMRGADEYTVLPKGELKPQLDTIVETMPESVVTDAPRRKRTREYVGRESGIRQNAMVVGEGGKVFVHRAGTLETANLTDAEEQKVKDMLAIRDAAKRVVDLQVKNASDSELETAQSDLQEKYKAYVLANGALSAPSNADLMDKDPDAPFLKALERNDALRKAKKDITADDSRMIKILGGRLTPEAGDVAKLQMPIFNQRVIHGLGEKAVTNVADAETVVKNEIGRLDFGVMADKLGKTEDEVIKELAEKKLIYKNPIEGEWEPADQYLTGDVRKKLKQAEAAASAKPREFSANVAALKAVQPEEITAGQIGARLGAPWIPDSDVNQFVKELLNARSKAKYWQGTSEKDQYFHYSPAAGEWVMSYKPDLGWDKSANEEYGTSRIDAAHLIDKILNGQLVEISDKVTGDDGKEKSVRNTQETIAAQEKAKLIKEKFQEWIWKDPERAERLTKEYNERFNNYRPRFFDGAHQEFPGISQKWSKWLHGHQKDAIWRVVQDRTALLAHEVGFGKTAVMVVGAQELRRLGLSKKNLFVVPKATHAQFREQYLDIYPYAKVLFPAEDDFTPAKRQEFMSRAVTGDWDAIIVSDSQFNKIPIKPEAQAKFLSQEMDTIRDAINETDDKKTQKELEKSLMRAQDRMEWIQQRIKDKADNTIYFEDMGVDQMFVDEADNFKNLHFTTKMGRIKGLPNSESDRAWDMYEKVRTLQEDKHNGVVFATGTPIANTIAEGYTMMRYLQEPMLEEKGLKHFDAWAATFGETTESLEQTPTGAYKLTQRFAKFNNAPELSNLWQQTADIRVADEVPEMVKQRPRIVDEKGKNKRIVISAPPDAALTGYMAELAARADKLQSGKVDPHEDNMLKISSDARKASLDMRLVDPSAPVNPDGKIAKMSKKIAEIYDLTQKDKGAQIVFLDMGTPKAKDKPDEKPAEGDGTDGEPEETLEEAKLLKDVYSNIKAQLIADGVKAEDIAFIHDAKNPKQKVDLAEKINKGTIRVIIGSTQKLGVGMNIQERAAALHHLDCPWRPRDIEQREGRIVRQGNKVYGPKKDADGKVTDPGMGVRIYTYVTEKSFDSFMWQAVEAKSKAIKSIMRRSIPPRSIEDVDSFTMSAGEAKALASGDPDVLKAVTLKNGVTRLQMVRASHTDSRVRAETQLRNIPAMLGTLNKSAEALEKDSKLVRPDAKFAMTVKGTKYDERPAAGEALTQVIKDAKQDEDVAEYHGFKIRVNDQGPQSGYRFTVYNPETKYDYTLNPIPYSEVTAAGVLARLENQVKAIPNELTRTHQMIKDHESNLKMYKEQSEKPFDHAEQLKQMEDELARVEKRLQEKEEKEKKRKRGEAVEDDPDQPSDFKMPDGDGEEEDDGPAYRWGSRDEEVNPKAEVEALRNELEVVESPLEVKVPTKAAVKEQMQTINAIAKPISKSEQAERLREIEAYAAATGQTFKKPGAPEKPKAELPKGETPLALPAPTRSPFFPKENWELTRQEMLNDDTYGYKTLAGNYTPNRKLEAEYSHRQEIKIALKQGKPVPEAVLKDYPDLAPQGGQEVSRGPHKAEIAGSTPAPATKETLKAVIRRKADYGAGHSINIVEYEKDGERYITGTVTRNGETSAGWYFGKGVEGVKEANRIALLPDKEFSDAEDSDRYAWSKKRRELEGKPERKPRAKKPRKEEPSKDVGAEKAGDKLALLGATDPRTPRAEAIDRSRTALTVTHDYNQWAPKRNRVDLSGVDTKRAVTIRTVQDRERAPKEKPRFSIHRKSSGPGRGRDLGADIVRDRRGRHLRL